mmetsp:Transcript_10099/g.32466  ORF Transcript_10099/g.32466 Transcript_10099/m.32466 type:complete len:1299 (+) Transcript_10099:113-4009(+)
MANLLCEPTRSGLNKFIVYRTVSHVYVVGCNRPQTQYHVLKILRSVCTSSELKSVLCQDCCSYSKFELKEMLEMIHDGNRTHGGLCRIGVGYGLLGFPQFLDSPYIHIISQRRKVGRIGGCNIYSVKSTELLPIKAEKSSGVEKTVLRAIASDVNRRLNPTHREIAEQRYLGLYQFIDLSKDFYFSYTYDLTRTLQHNLINALPVNAREANPSPKTMYEWNAHLSRQFKDALGWPSASMWLVTLVHGAFQQRKCSIFGRIINIALVARRSRYFAGTRYLKRGVSDSGKVANDVEVEQIVHEEGAGEGTLSSFVQVRGSIPTFWTQETSVTMPKPPIVLNRIDPMYDATRAHFADLLRRYSAPISVLDLTKQTERREREMIVSHEYRRALGHINQDFETEETGMFDVAQLATKRQRQLYQDSVRVRYCALDFSQVSKHRQLNVLDSLEEVARWSIHQTRFFCGTTAGEDRARVEQNGVLRTNCIDCLDRTNVAQFVIGAHALGRTLAITGAWHLSTLESGNQLSQILMELYSAVGDLISLQYGGSEAHKKMGTSQQPSTTQAANQLNDIGGTTKHKELLTSIRRYYSNAFTDRLKQDAMNVFLGNYGPRECHFIELPLWELESDYYLHNFHVQNGTLLSMKVRRESWLSSSDEDICVRGTVSDGSTADTATEHAHMSGVWCRRSRVVRRCRRQTKVLSQWWRSALESHEDGKASAGGTRPQHIASLESEPRFERMHKPLKLTQFDRTLGYEFCFPVEVAREIARSTGSIDASRRCSLSGMSFSGQYVRHSGARNREDSKPADDAYLVFDQHFKGECGTVAAPRVRQGKFDVVPTASCFSMHYTDGGSFSLNPHEQPLLRDARERDVVQHDFTRSATGAASHNGQLEPAVLESLGRKLPYRQDNSPTTFRKLVQELRSLQSKSIAKGSPLGTLGKHECATTTTQENSSLRTLNLVIDLAVELVMPNETTPLQSIPGTSSLTSIGRSDECLGCPISASSHEFEAALKECNLHPHDVEDVLESASSAGVGTILTRGPYRGLHRGALARNVVALVNDSLDRVFGMERRRLFAFPENVGDEMCRRHRRDANMVIDFAQNSFTMPFPQRQHIGYDEWHPSRGSPPTHDMRMKIDSEQQAAGVLEQITSQLSQLALSQDSYIRDLDPQALSSPFSLRTTDDCRRWYGLFCSDTGDSAHTLSEACDDSIRNNRRMDNSQPPAACRDVGIGRFESSFSRVGPDLYAFSENKYMLFNEIGVLAALAAHLIPSCRVPPGGTHDIVGTEDKSHLVWIGKQGVRRITVAGQL